jgi:hypothetical protein
MPRGGIVEIDVFGKNLVLYRSRVFVQLRATARKHEIDKWQNQRLRQA